MVPPRNIRFFTVESVHTDSRCFIACTGNSTRGWLVHFNVIFSIFPVAISKTILSFMQHYTFAIAAGRVEYLRFVRFPGLNRFGAIYHIHFPGICEFFLLWYHFVLVRTVKKVAVICIERLVYERDCRKSLLRTLSSLFHVLLIFDFVLEDNCWKSFKYYEAIVDIHALIPRGNNL